jgi:hypothetical protein
MELKEQNIMFRAGGSIWGEKPKQYCKCDKPENHIHKDFCEKCLKPIKEVKND